ncbi:MAG: hypothetical protein K2X03_04245 [Bryobacteraceae bacterium]|nr:hypothetical protein [Bryobacteraceae bacterium]
MLPASLPVEVLDLIGEHNASDVLACGERHPERINFILLGSRGYRISAAGRLPRFLPRGLSPSSFTMPVPRRDLAHQFLKRVRGLRRAFDRHFRDVTVAAPHLRGYGLGQPQTGTVLPAGNLRGCSMCLP